ncbi:hypothetical protein LMG28614_05682 [Paraburkholderia ultramafica]|uniref:Uncharacterized protein n=1 Tax=Paraburkholderia ultramafica TaxID=1544867 RepID=A0A6S7BL50_9BURK|nr:hypothetical protein LMG28614_05682 [Paraburkholderia ultramafica]
MSFQPRPNDHTDPTKSPIERPDEPYEPIPDPRDPENYPDSSPPPSHVEPDNPW